MGRIASGAMYLATPLAFAAHPAIAKSGVTSGPLLSVELQTDAPAPRAYVVVTVPADTHLAGDRSLNAAIDYEVRRRITAPLTRVGATDLLDGDAGPAFPDLGADRKAGNLGEAVIATHAERIAFLRQRIDTQRSAGVDARTLANLRTRLLRAEAARRLAVARTDVQRIATPSCITEREPECVSTAKRLATRMKVRAAPTKPLRHAIGAPPRLILAVGSRLQQVHSPGTAIAKPKAATGAAPGVTPSLRVMATSTDRLTHARTSLAKARSSLATIADARPAGLLHFPGSETWSLTRIA